MFPVFALNPFTDLQYAGISISCLNKGKQYFTNRLQWLKQCLKTDLFLLKVKPTHTNMFEET